MSIGKLENQVNVICLRSQRINLEAKGAVTKWEARSKKGRSQKGRTPKFLDELSLNCYLTPVRCIFEGNPKVPPNDSWENKRTEQFLMLPTSRKNDNKTLQKLLNVPRKGEITPY